MKRKGFRAALFDLDGTLLDTLPDIASAVNTALASMGVPGRTPHEIRACVGGGMRDLAGRVLPDDMKSEQEIDACLALIQRAYGARSMVDTVPYPGIPELVENLAGSGWVMAVVSNKLDEFTQEIIRHYFPGRFRFVTGARPDVPRKPDPAMAIHAVEALHVPAAFSAFIGDSSVDMLTAVAAGMQPVGVSWGFRSREEILTAGDVPVLDSAADLEGFLLELR